MDRVAGAARKGGDLGGGNHFLDALASTTAPCTSHAQVLVMNRHVDAIDRQTIRQN